MNFPIFLLDLDKNKRLLPSGAKERKEYPLATGLLDYFPDALACIANVSKVGNDQHNPGQPVHWDRNKSMDQGDTLMRCLRELRKSKNAAG